MGPASRFVFEPVPELPGWHTWDLTEKNSFNPVVMGKLLVRQESERSARLRLPETQARHGNLLGVVHGAVILGLIDISLFAVMHTVLECDAAGSVTLDLNCQFIGSGVLGKPLDAVGEVMKETGRLVFLRGTVEQDHGLVASFQGTIRKPTRR